MSSAKKTKPGLGSVMKQLPVPGMALGETSGHQNQPTLPLSSHIEGSAAAGHNSFSSRGREAGVNLSVGTSGLDWKAVKTGQGGANPFPRLLSVDSVESNDSNVEKDVSDDSELVFQNCADFLKNLNSDSWEAKKPRRPPVKSPRRTALPSQVREETITAPTPAPRFSQPIGSSPVQSREGKISSEKGDRISRDGSVAPSKANETRGETVIETRDIDTGKDELDRNSITNEDSIGNAISFIDDSQNKSRAQNKDRQLQSKDKGEAERELEGDFKNKIASKEKEKLRFEQEKQKEIEKDSARKRVEEEKEKLRLKAEQNRAKEEEEAKARKEQESKKKKEEEEKERIRIEEEKERQKEEQEKKSRLDEELRRKKAEEEARINEELKKRKEEEQKKRLEEELKQKEREEKLRAEKELAKKKAEEEKEKLRLEAEQKQKKEKEEAEARRQQELKKKKEAEEEERLRVEEERKRQKEEQEKTARHDEELRRKKAEEEARIEEELKRKEEEEKARIEEELTRKKAEDEEKQRVQRQKELEKEKERQEAQNLLEEKISQLEVVNANIGVLMESFDEVALNLESEIFVTDAVEMIAEVEQDDASSMSLAGPSDIIMNDDNYTKAVENRCEIAKNSEMEEQADSSQVQKRPDEKSTITEKLHGDSESPHDSSENSNQAHPIEAGNPDLLNEPINTDRGTDQSGGQSEPELLQKESYAQCSNPNLKNKLEADAPDPSTNNDKQVPGSVEQLIEAPNPVSVSGPNDKGEKRSIETLPDDSNIDPPSDLKETGDTGKLIGMPVIVAVESQKCSTEASETGERVISHQTDQTPSNGNSLNSSKTMINSDYKDSPVHCNQTSTMIAKSEKDQTQDFSIIQNDPGPDSESGIKNRNRKNSTTRSLASNQESSQTIVDVGNEQESGMTVSFLSQSSDEDNNVMLKPRMKQGDPATSPIPRSFANARSRAEAARNDMLSTENSGLRDRVSELERKVQEQEDELVLMRSSMADVLRRLRILEGDQGGSTKTFPSTARQINAAALAAGLPSKTVSRSTGNLRKNSATLPITPVDPPARGSFRRTVSPSPRRDSISGGSPLSSPVGNGPSPIPQSPISRTSSPRRRASRSGTSPIPGIARSKKWVSSQDFNNSNNNHNGFASPGSHGSGFSPKSPSGTRFGPPPAPSSIAVHPNRLVIASGQSAKGGGIKNRRNASQADMDILLEEGENLPHVRIWDSITLQTQQVLGIGEFERAVSCVAFSRSDGGGLLAAVDESYEHTLSLWDWSKKKKLTETKSSNEQVLAMEFHPTEKHLIVTCGKNHINFWAYDGVVLQKRLGIIEGRDKPKYIICVAFSERGEILSGDSNGTISVWDPKAGKVLRQASKAHNGGVFSICSMKGGGILSGGGRDRRIMEWSSDLRNTGRAVELPDTAGPVRAIAQGKGNLFMVGTTHNSILQGSIDSGFKFLLQGHMDELWGLCPHPLQQQFLTCGYDRTLRLWDSISRSLIWLKDIADPAHCASFHPGGAVVAVGTTVGRWLVLDAMTRDVVVGQKDGNDIVSCLGYSPDGRMFAVGSHDGSLCIYTVSEDARRYSRLGKCGPLNYPITALDWSSDGQIIRTNSKDNEVLYWHSLTCKQITQALTIRETVWESNQCPVNFENVGVWPDGADGTEINSVHANSSKSLVVAAHDSGSIRLFRFPSCQPRASYGEYSGHSSHVTCVRFLQNDSRIMSIGSKDFAIFQWSQGKLF